MLGGKGRVEREGLCWEGRAVLRGRGRVGREGGAMLGGRGLVGREGLCWKVSCCIDH